MAKKDAIVLYPAPGIGHLVSMVELGKLIMNHNHASLSVTILLTTGFLDTPSTDSYVRHVSAANPSISFLRFPFQPVDSAPTRSRAAVAFHFIRLNRPNVARALQDLSTSSGGKIRAFVIDLFCTSALDIAREMGIPAYYFFTSGAAVLAAFLHFPALHSRSSASFKDMADVSLNIPGMPPLEAPQMPEPMLDREDPAYWDMLHFCSSLTKSNGIITNTFAALEPIPIGSALLAEAGGIPPLYHVGPVIAEPEADPAANDYLQWLDMQPRGSVVLLCFGSMGAFSEAQAREVAAGLERSSQRFLWCLRRMNENKLSTETDLVFLGEGFEERTRGRGVVVERWVPQAVVLKSDAVGGFVTHCGWNSVLEAVAEGVPMAAWPMYAEQHMNRNVMVRDLKVAIKVELGEDGFVGADEVERSVRELMESERGIEVRSECARLKLLARAALAESGSSAVALDEFLGSIMT